MRLLDERRQSLVEQSTRLRNQLHAILRERVPGGVDKDTSTEVIAITLRRITATTAADTMRIKLGLEMIGDLRRLEFQILDIAERTEAALKESGTTITNICGVGPVMAGRILGRTGHPKRFQQQQHMPAIREPLPWKFPAPTCKDIGSPVVAIGS